MTEEEIGELEARRKEEKKLVCERDALTTSQGMHEGLWYIITSEWLAEWKSFIFNKSYPGVLVNLSPNKRVGVLPPGPISNHTLFLKARQSTQILKLNLHKVIYIYIYIEHRLSGSEPICVGGIYSYIWWRSSNCPGNIGYLW